MRTLDRLAAEAITIACCEAERRMAVTCVRRAGASLPNCPSVGPPRNFRFAPPISSRGMAEGPALGDVLTLAEDAWLAADFPLEEALASIADQAAAPASRERKT